MLHVRGNDIRNLVDRHLWFHEEIWGRKIDCGNCVFVDKATFVSTPFCKLTWTKSNSTPVGNETVSQSGDANSVSCIGAIASCGTLCLSIKILDQTKGWDWESSNKNFDSLSFLRHLNHFNEHFNTDKVIALFF